MIITNKVQGKQWQTGAQSRLFIILKQRITNYKKTISLNKKELVFICVGWYISSTSTCTCINVIDCWQENSWFVLLSKLKRSERLSR